MDMENQASEPPTIREYGFPVFNEPIEDANPNDIRYLREAELDDGPEPLYVRDASPWRLLEEQPRRESHRTPPRR